jgi:hypothetical protein
LARTGVQPFDSNGDTPATAQSTDPATSITMAQSASTFSVGAD